MCDLEYFTCINIYHKAIPDQDKVRLLPIPQTEYPEINAVFKDSVLIWSCIEMF